MVNLTISLPEETVEKLRRTVRERYGGKKGAISGLIKEALEERIDARENALPPTRFRAYDGGRLVAEAGDLEGLAAALKRRGVDPRAVRIVSSSPTRRLTRAGLPGKRV